MAEKTYTSQTLLYNTLLISWTGVTNADTFQPYPCINGLYSDLPVEISIHVTGIFDGTTVNIYGGNVDSSISALLQQLDGDNATITSENILSILDRPLYIKPQLTGGSSSLISVYMVIKYQ